jgi:hypothetical protein
MVILTPLKLIVSSQYQLLPLNFGNQIIVNINSIYSIEFVNIKSVFLPLLGTERYLKSSMGRG